MKITVDVAPKELAEFIFNLMDISVEADTDNVCQCDQRTETIKPIEATIKPAEATTDKPNLDGEFFKELVGALAKAMLDKALSEST